MENWKESVSFLLGVAFFAFFLVNFSNWWQTSPDEIQIQIDKTIEIKIAREAKLTILEAEYFQSKNAGDIITTTSPTDFIFRIKRNNIESVFYATEKGDSFIKRYWGIASNGEVFEFEQEYAPSTKTASAYAAKEYNEDMVIFRKTITSSVLGFWVLIILLSFVISEIVYVVLWIAEKLVLYAKRITSHPK